MLATPETPANRLRMPPYERIMSVADMDDLPTYRPAEILAADMPEVRRWLTAEEDTPC